MLQKSNEKKINKNLIVTEKEEKCFDHVTHVGYVKN